MKEKLQSTQFNTERKYTILVADDYDSNIAVIDSIFEESGQHFNLLYAKDGLEACEEAIKHKPDLIIMDWEMPQMNGIEALGFLKKREDTKHIPVIMTTAFSSSEHLETALQAGAIDYVRKPIDEIELLARVNSALQLVSSYRQILEQKEEIEEKTYKLKFAFDEIERKNQKIMGSIKYAQRIQEAMLPQISAFEALFEEAFIFFKPRDLVSGDFYWFFEKENKIFIAAVDCTGHGVPGAFMSMLGDAYLNQIVGMMNVSSPDEILNQLHISIKNALKQDETQNRDGMDIAICVIDKSRGVLEFAGAKNPLVFIDGKEVVRIKGDTFSIGGRREDKLFQKHVIELKEKPTSFYIFSDGYQDQFSSGMRSKFMAKRFRKLLLRLQRYPFKEQRVLLEQILSDWMRDTKQIDDILVMGFRI
ncbi:MAG: response regulator [Bernardetiaceae bacterium]|nr:response regulator [Bernardetiaceae bacterium]